MRGRTLIITLCIGSACALLQPEQPQSAIATGLLIVAFITLDVVPK